MSRWGEGRKPNEYHPPLEIDLEVLRREIPNHEEAIVQVTAALISMRQNMTTGDHQGKNRSLTGTPDSVATEILGLDPTHNGNKLWHKLLTVALAYAQLDPAYWGVNDPEKEAYCCQCHKVRPIEMFTMSKFTCDPHFFKRREQKERANV